MAEKRYYWLKLEESFFAQKEIKRLRRLAGGDTYTILYLKMLLKSLEANGRLYFDGIEDNFIAELAMDIDEEEDNVRVTVEYLTAKGILEARTEDEYELITAAEMTGSETKSAVRKRRSRENVTHERENVTHERDNVTRIEENVQKCHIEKEIEKEIELDKDIKRKKRGFAPPSLEEVRKYCHERGSKISPEAFIDYYSSNDWKVGRNKMKDWKAAVRTWEHRDESKQTAKTNTAVDAGDYDDLDGIF